MARIEEVLAGDEPVWKYLLDVLGHLGIGAGASIGPIALAVLVFDAGFLVGQAVGQPCAIAAGTFREVRQYRKTGKLHLLDRVLDVAHHVLGPPVAWAIVIGIRAAIT